MQVGQLGGRAWLESADFSMVPCPVKMDPAGIWVLTASSIHSVRGLLSGELDCTSGRDLLP